MTTPSEFLERVDDAIDDAVQTLTHIAPVGRMAWLGRFQFRVAAQWRRVFAPYMDASDVDGMVADIVQTVQTRLAEIESVVAPTLH
jgi:hypothetical protein